MQLLVAITIKAIENDVKINKYLIWQKSSFYIAQINALQCPLCAIYVFNLKLPILYIYIIYMFA